VFYFLSFVLSFGILQQRTEVKSVGHVVQLGNYARLLPGVVTKSVPS